MSAKGATGIGNVIPVGDYRNCVVKIGTASSANMTIKAQGAIASINAENTPPAFGSAQSVSNNWDYVQMIDLNDGSAITGDTGLVLTGTDDFRLFEININGLDFISFVITARSAGTATIDVQLSSNL